MVDLLDHLVNLLFFDIPLLYFIITLILAHQSFSPFYSGDIYLYLNISSPFVSELFYGEVSEALVILTAILFPVKSPVASAVFESIFSTQS